MTKKKIEYFGYLKGEKLNELTLEQKLNYFVSKKLFTTTKVVKLTSNTAVNLLDSNNYKIVHEPVRQLLEAYYYFITHTFQEHINTVLIDFFHVFNNQIIGLKNKESKMIGRLYFLNIINNKHSPNFDIVRMSENANGIPKVDNAPKLELYYIKRDAIKNRTATEYSLGLDEFLMGNSNHFNNKMISEIPILQEIIQYEGELKILLALNEEYQFEKNIVSPPPMVKNGSSINIEPSSNPPSDKLGISVSMPTEEEMDAYLMKHVFSKKD